MSIPFTIPSGVANAYLSGTVLITGGMLNDIDFRLVNTDTGAVLMSQMYYDQGNIGMYIPTGGQICQGLLGVVISSHILKYLATIHGGNLKKRLMKMPRSRNGKHLIFNGIHESDTHLIIPMI